MSVRPPTKNKNFFREDNMTLPSKHLVQIALIALTFSAPTLAWAQAPPADDSWVQVGDNSNHGKDPRLNVQLGGGTEQNQNHNPDTVWGQNQNTYIRFDLTKFPANLTAASIQKATVTLFVNEVVRGGTFWVCKLETQ